MKIPFIHEYAFDIILKARSQILLFPYMFIKKGKYKIFDVKAFNYDNK